LTIGAIAVLFIGFFPEHLRIFLAASVATFYVLRYIAGGGMPPWRIETREAVGTLRVENLLIICKPEIHAICRNCGWNFTPETSQSVDGKVAQIVQQYDAHRKEQTCKREDAS
jgi:hypothetical protein